METLEMQSRVSSQQQFFLHVLERAGPSTLGQLVWARVNEGDSPDWATTSELPTITARENRSVYNSTRRSLDRMVEQGMILKEIDRNGQLRYRSSPPLHAHKMLALANLAQAKLGPGHYQQLLSSGATAKTVIKAICSTTGWTPNKTRTAVESIAKVLEIKNVTNEITIGEEEFTNESWDEFLALPMGDVLVDYTGGGFAHRSPAGFDDRYKLALTFVKLLSLVGVLVGGAVLIASLRQTNDVTTGIAAGGVSLDTPVVCEPIDLRNGIPIPESISCDDGELVATGDLDGAWNGNLSGWDVPDGMIVGGLWQNWDDGTPEPSGFEPWTGRNAHSDTDPADNRYQEIRITRIAPGDFSIFENRGLTGRTVTFRFIPTGGPVDTNPAATGPQQFTLTSGRPIAVQGAELTSIIWDGQQTEADRTVDWEGDDDLESATVLVGELIADDVEIEAIRGIVRLDPGTDGTESGMSGGLFLRMYENRELGLAGGKSAQLGLVNTQMGPIVDRTSGICPHDECTVRNSVEYVTAESVDLDASDGLGFHVSVTDDMMTMRLWSIAQPSQPDAVVTEPWPGDIGAAAIELWATDWSFAGQVDDVRVTYATPE